MNRLDLEVRFDPGDAGTFTGRASIFGDPPDNYGDVVSHGAFRRSLDEHAAAGTAPLLLWQHRADEPIGTWTALRETRAALEVEGRLVLETQRGREAYELMKAGALNGLSIGFKTRRSEARKGGGRLLRDLDLVEISVVSLPAAARARVHAVRSVPMDADLPVPADDTAPDPIETRVAALETRPDPVPDLAARLDRVETRLSRPSARIEVREDKEALERKAFLAYCRRGIDGMSDVEKKVLSVIPQGSPDASGAGYQLVPEVFLQEIMRQLVLVSPMRQVARVQQVAGTPILLPKRTDTLAAKWVAETAQHDTDQPSYTQQSIPVFEARVTVEVTNQLLEDSAFNLAAELSQDIAEAFGYLEGIAFVSGNGTTEPEGFLTSSDFDSSGSSVSADSLIDLYHKVPSIYASRGTWLMRRETMGTVRKLRSATDGPYIWADSLVPGNPATLLGRPVVEMPGMAVDGASPDDMVVAFGDWNRAYRIFDRVGLELLRDPYTLARYSVVCFHARRRVGGALVDGEAVYGLTA